MGGRLFLVLALKGLKGSLSFHVANVACLGGRDSL